MPNIEINSETYEVIVNGKIDGKTATVDPAVTVPPVTIIQPVLGLMYNDHFISLL